MASLTYFTYRIKPSALIALGHADPLPSYLTGESGGYPDRRQAVHDVKASGWSLREVIITEHQFTH